MNRNIVKEIDLSHMFRQRAEWYVKMYSKLDKYEAFVCQGLTSDIKEAKSKFNNDCDFHANIRYEYSKANEYYTCNVKVYYS